MICPYCGHKLSNDAEFCSNCRKPQIIDGMDIPFIIPDTIEESINTRVSAISLNGEYLAMCVAKIETSSGYELQIMNTSTKDIDHQNINVDDKYSALGKYTIAVSPKGNYATGHYKNACFNGDGEFFAYTNNSDDCIKIINAQKRCELLSIYGEHDFFTYSYDSKYIATPSSKWIILWDANTGKKLNYFDINRDIISIAFSHDGKRIAIATGLKGTIIIDANTGDLLLQFIEPHMDCRYVRFSPNDKAIIVCYNYRIFKIVNSDTGEILGQFNHGEELLWASYTANGKRIITYSSNQIKIWGKK
jgi:WD40 repeat protein